MRVARATGESGLSHGQIQIWTGQTLNPGDPLYNMTFAFVLEGAIDAVAFRSAWQRLVDASDALRTSIDERGGLGVRRLREPGGCQTAFEDLSDRADPERDFRAWARARCRRALPLDGELVDSVLVKLGERRYGWYLNQHHLVTDATATVLLFRRMASEYAATVAGTAASVAAATESYYSTVRALQSFPDDRIRQDAIEHWTRRLEHDRSTPFYGRSITPASTRSQRLTMVLDDETSRRLRDIAEQPGFLSFTPDISRFALFATLLIGWLHRVSAKDELGFDSPAQCRPSPGAKRSLGLFIEMFPFAVSVAAGDSFRTLGQTCLAEAHRFLRCALPGTSSPSGATVSNVVLNFFSGTFGAFAGLPVSAEWIHAGHGDHVHALRLQVHDYVGSGRYTLDFDFNEDVFPPPLRERALRHFERVLAALLDNPDQPIAAIDILTDAERDALVYRFNDTYSRPLPTRTVPEIFREQSSRNADRIAVRQGRREITYHELARRVDAAAAQLADAGVGPGIPVAILMKRSIEAVIAILAVLRARGAYVPLDPAYPEARVRHVLEDSGAAIVIVQPGAERAGLPATVGVLALDDVVREPVSPEPANLRAPRLDDLAYIIYTSGSTGRPRGVQVEHGGLVDYLEWASREYVRGDRLSFPLFTSLSFDLTVTSVFLPLLTGGTLVIYEELDGPVDTALMAVVADNLVDVIKLTPSHLSLFRQLDLSASRIRRIVVGGEDFKAGLAAAIGSQFEHEVEIYNEYGPTEAVVGCMVHRYDPAVDTGTSVPIGRPADHVRLYVLNQALSPVPEGVPGELCISRYGLARGYRGRDEMTARQFVPHPFLQGERLYRTGDLARFINPRQLEYLGRLDRQLKISGVRVEPGEIEAALLTHDAVKECVVIGHAGGFTSASAAAADQCERCGIASNVPGIVFDAAGVCSVCRSYDAIRDDARAYFKTMKDLAVVFEESSARHNPRYDCMMLLSGGKDSTYALCRLVDMGLRVYAFTLDNGYLSDQAKDNIRRVVQSLGVAHEFATTPAMRSIFRDSLMRFSNVCNGCFKTIYTLGTQRAHQLAIPIVVTGLSRGQLFETRLSEKVFRDGRCSPEEIDLAVLAARKAYHRLDDHVARSLDVTLFQDDRIFEQIQFIDFYRYCDASLEEILSSLTRRVPWMRPSDTGRSTNCLINDVGIYIHRKERGHHNYAVPYSWDVRMGHKTRGQALAELNDDLDLDRVRTILSEVGYDEDRLTGAPSRTRLAAYYVAAGGVSERELRHHLASRLPPQLVPHYFTRLDAVPLNPNGKVDLAALPPVDATGEPASDGGLVPVGPVQERIAAVWRQILRVDRIAADKSFFELGGNSLAAMEVVLQLCNEFQIDLPLQTVFQYPTVAALAGAVENRIVEEVAALSEEEADRLATDPGVGT